LFSYRNYRLLKIKCQIIGLIVSQNNIKGCGHYFALRVVRSDAASAESAFLRAGKAGEEQLSGDKRGIL